MTKLKASDPKCVWRMECELGEEAQADIYDPELNPKFAAFCEHYDIVALPTRPRTPEHKGRVERGVGYVKESASKARPSTPFSKSTLTCVAGKRPKPTGASTAPPSGKFTVTLSRAKSPLCNRCHPGSSPPLLKPNAKSTATATSNSNAPTTYYEVPPEYISRELWVRSDGRIVRLFNTRDGQFTKVLGCGDAPTGSVLENLKRWEKRAAERIGPDAGLWAKGLIIRRKEAALRVLMGLINQLLPRHGSAALNRACAQARQHGQYRSHRPR